MSTQARDVLDKIGRLLDQQPEKPESSTSWKAQALADIRRTVPKAYQTARIRDFADLPGAAALAEAKTGVFLTGRTGTGKTHLATAIMVEHMKPDETGNRMNSVCWTDAPGLLCRIRSSFRDGRHETEMAIINEMVAYQCLLLDDLGAEKQTDWSAATLYTIIARRRNAERLTIVTSNHKLSEINEWEPRLASRLAEFSTIKLPEADRRLKRIKTNAQS